MFFRSKTSCRLEQQSTIYGKMKQKFKKSGYDKQRVQTFVEVFDNILGSIREPLVVLDSDLKVVKANHSFYQTFNVKPDETEGILIYDLGNRQWNIPKLRELLEDILPENSVFNDFEVEHNFETIGRKIMHLNARRIYTKVEPNPADPFGHRGCDRAGIL